MEMRVDEREADHCAYCASALEIVSVRFKIRRTVILRSCPNCAITSAEDSVGSNVYQARQLTKIVRGLRQRSASIVDLLNLRFKYVLAFLIGALITAAALRHGFHVYGGLSREEIRQDALIAIPAVVLALVLFRRKRSRE
jgi:hypothetical protein